MQGASLLGVPCVRITMAWGIWRELPRPGDGMCPTLSLVSLGESDKEASPISLFIVVYLANAINSFSISLRRRELQVCGEGECSMGCLLLVDLQRDPLASSASSVVHGALVQSVRGMCRLVLPSVARLGVRNC